MLPSKLFLSIIVLTIHEAAGFSLGSRSTGWRLQGALRAVDQSLSELHAKDANAAKQPASVWTPKSVPLLESMPQHVIIDDSFAHLEKVSYWFILWPFAYTFVATLSIFTAR